MNNNSNIVISEIPWNGIRITKTANEQINQLINNSGSNQYIGIRVNIKKSGCAGFKYFLEKIKKIENEELIIYYPKFIISIPKKFLKILDGLEIDFQSEGINKIFKFKNSKINEFCGCGKSFNINLK